MMRAWAALLAALLALPAGANTANVVWTLPTSRTDGAPLSAAEIAAVRIAWGKCNAAPEGTRDVAPPELSTAIEGLASGTWCFSARTVDTGGLTSDPVTVSQSILAPPNSPGNVTVTVTVSISIPK